MKQLKFMLAAATAISLATAAQAATSTLDSESFNGYTDGQAVIDSDGVALIDGFSYNGTAGDNESTIIKETEDDMALKVNTGTDPLLRKINYDDGTAVDLSESGFNYLNIDTKVQFTVTPKSDKDNVTAVAGDKLMIYLLETDDGNVLMAKAAAYSEEGAWIDGGKDFRLTLPESIDAVEPNKWYRLVVKAKAFVAGVDEETEAPNAWWPFFQIYIAEENDSDLSDNLCTNDDTDGAGYEVAGIDFGDEIASDYFLSLAVDSSIGDAFGPQSEALKLTHVGFAGEGKVDDFVVTKDYTSTSVDFTLALGEGVSAVQWTINDNDKTNADSFSAPAGTTLNVAIKSVTYEAGYAGTQDWTGYTYSAAASGSVKITAEKFADVSEGGVVTPTDETVKAVTTGSFTVPEATEGNAEAVAEAKADLAKALTWASSKAGKSYTAAIAAINGMTFDEDGDPSGTGDAKTNAEAYLLDCAANQTAIDKAMEDFVLTGFSIGADGAMTFGVGEAAKGNGTAYANGKIEVRGKAALNAANWVKDCPGATFFKAFLVK